MSPRREDRLTLAGVRMRPRIGVTPGERRLPQPCEADITLMGDFEAAASTDSLERAMDYSRILTLVAAVSESREFNLLETLAFALGRALLEAFPANGVQIRVRKRPVSMVGKLEHIQVEVQLP